jgi:hypothetical protein
MDIQDIWDKILDLSKNVFIPALLADAKRFGFENTHAKRADIEDFSILTLIWAADFASRKRGHNSISDALLSKFDNHGLYLERLSEKLSAKPPPYPPNLTKVLYKELSHTLEKTLPIRNQIGFAFFQNTVGKVGFSQNLRDSSRGKRYKKALESCIQLFEEEFS